MKRKSVKQSCIATILRTGIICARPVEQDAVNNFSQRGDWNEGPIDMDAINNLEWVDTEVYGDQNVDQANYGRNFVYIL